MINNWLKFNESEDNIKEKLIKIFEDVRECFLEWEDMKIVENYRFLNNGFLKGEYDVRFHKNMKESEFLSKREIKLFNQISVNIKFPGENWQNETILNLDSIKLFNDIIEISDRLVDLGCDVKLDMNAKHHQYKPMKFLIYFNI